MPRKSGKRSWRSEKKAEAELKEHFGDRFKGFHVKWSEEDAKAEETEESEIAEDAEKESETIGGSVGVNVGKTARKIAAAKTTSQLRAVIENLKYICLPQRFRRIPSESKLASGCHKVLH